MKQRMMLYGLTLMLGCFVLASCVNDDEGPCLSSNGKTQVLFSLVLQDNAQTRADGDVTWGNYSPKKEGVGYDNKIDLAGVQMLLFKGNEYAGKLKDLTYTIPEENVYNYIGTAPDDLATGDYKFVILANAPTITPASLDDENFANLAFTYLGGNSLPNIPMWGTKGVTAETKLTVEKGTRQDIGKISLLRAVSKVTVKLTGTAEATRNYSLKKVTVNKYNKNGYVLPSGYAGVTETTDLVIDDANTMHVNATSTGSDLAFEPAAAGDKEITFYLPEYVNSANAPVEVLVTLTKEVTVGGVTKTIEFEAPVEFCKYADGVPATGTDAELYNITRNHWYQFNITQVSDDGKLYVNPTVAPWIDAEELEYKINVSTSMRLFDSWLYRYDTDNNYNNWNESHLVVAPGVDATSTPAGMPLYSPQIQLVTTNPDGPVELRLDNTNFQFIKVTKNEDGTVASYTASSPLQIAAGTGTYTYFYIVPKEGVTFTDENKVAKVTMIYDDPQLGEMKLTFNNNSLPGYSDDSSEIWVYYFPAAEYNNSNGDKLKMYYQDINNPLVPTENQD